MYMSRRENESLTLYHTILTFNNPEKKSLLKIPKEKKKNVGNQHYLLFPQCLQLLSQREIVNIATLNLSANAFNLVMSKNLLFVS